MLEARALSAILFVCSINVISKEAILRRLLKLYGSNETLFGKDENIETKISNCHVFWWGMNGGYL